ncbi:LacI family DNA-binding transcriptional regulator [Bifidobacterium vansinderenii]|uniref:LacI-type transcriptional regulator n=1 Tax=Bifidobacterium vansinderenii TaxID=1984871 RepID=A0A229VWZ5_9BIFI|nr:LacI family DNA-binding transcriptional regulator [Bifidobacterium vansinderenii]OXM99929.1 LacI-type transcriptional regulator [Bifidobacterium vansinderenii]
MVGMRDVARRAGVSLSTVSLAVNGTGYVAESTRARIEEAMAELNYVPNELARNLFRGRTNLIGVTIPTVAHPFFAQLTASLQRHLHDAGLRMMLCSTADQERGESEYIDMLKRQMMDGIIIGSHTNQRPEYWQGIGRPVVAFDRFLGEEIPSVCSDHVQGAHLAARLLIESGVRHVVEIGGPRSQFHDLAEAQTADGSFESVLSAAADAVTDVNDTTFPTVRYHLTFEREMAAAGVRCDYVSVEHVSDTSLFERAAEEVFRRFPDTDAIIAPDLAAAHCVRLALRELRDADTRGSRDVGRRIPDDLQIIAYDGTPVADLAGMRVTSVHQDLDAIAVKLVERMKEAIADEHASESAASESVSASAVDVYGTADAPAQVAASCDLVPVTLMRGETTR